MCYFKTLSGISSQKYALSNKQKINSNRSETTYTAVILFLHIPQIMKDSCIIFTGLFSKSPYRKLFKALSKKGESFLFSSQWMEICFFH